MRDLRIDLRITLFIAVAAATLGCGCARHAAPLAGKAPATGPLPPAGRLVPAVVAGFEHGYGGWQVSVSPRELPRVRIVRGSASRGNRWLSVQPAGRPTGAHTIDMYADLPRVDWSRFGDTLRADILAKGNTAGVTARMYVVGADGVEAAGPQEQVRGDWRTIIWHPRAGLTDVKRIGIRWRVPETYLARLGLDNVRVGAEAGLNDAWSVATGPFLTREDAVVKMTSLQERKVPSFPVYVEGWYLNVGTFSSETAARAESKRLAAQGVATAVIQR